MADDPYARIAELEAENAALSERAVRAETALAESTEQQVATDDILRVIASSSADLGKVLAVLVASLSRLVGADRVVAMQREGDDMIVLASTGDDIRRNRVPIGGSVNGRAFREARTVRVHGTPAEQIVDHHHAPLA